MPTEFQRRIAHFAARRLFLDGVELRDHDWRAQPYKPGSLHLMFQQDRNGISRPVAHLHQRNEAFTIDLFPPLWSVKIVAITEYGCALTGGSGLASATSAKRGTSCLVDRTNRIAPPAQAFQPFVTSTFRSVRSATIFAGMYWRNILDVAREERLDLMRERAISEPPSLAAQAMIGRRNAEGDFKAPSIEGLEVVELTVLDVSPAAAPR